MNSTCFLKDDWLLYGVTAIRFYSWEFQTLYIGQFQNLTQTVSWVMGSALILLIVKRKLCGHFKNNTQANAIASS
jgi:lipoate-protein ligase A